MQNKTKILKNVNWPSVFRILKWAVPVVIFLALYRKFYRNPALSFEYFFNSLFELDWWWIPLLLLFSFANWATETRKWQYLICKLELQSFMVAFKSVFCGVAVSQLLPYRTGEYLGRLAFVKDHNKVNAGILSIAGSFSQLMVTLILGGIAFLVLQPIEVPLNFLLSIAALLVLVVLGYFHLPQFGRIRNLPLFVAIGDALKLLKLKDLARLMTFSTLRYLLFLLPYALLAQHYGLGLKSNFVFIVLSVSCIYFLQTVSPNFILTDLAIRISVPSLIFSGTFDQSNGIDYLPGLIIYLFNVVVPMCIGAVILVSMRLKK